MSEADEALLHILRIMLENFIRVLRISDGNGKFQKRL